MSLINSFSDDYEGMYTQQDIEELDSHYEEEQEYFGLIESYDTVMTNIAYYTETQLHALLDRINLRLTKDV